MEKQVLEDLAAFFKCEEAISVGYLFGSQVEKAQTPQSDIDIALLLSETPEKLLEYYLYLIDGLSRMLGNGVDLVILNTSPPLLKHQVIRQGKVIYSRCERARVEFEARAQSEYLDFQRAIARYNECLLKQILA